MAETGHAGDDGIDGGTAERIRWSQLALLYVETFLMNRPGEVRKDTWTS